MWWDKGQRDKYLTDTAKSAKKSGIWHNRKTEMIDIQSYICINRQVIFTIKTTFNRQLLVIFSLFLKSLLAILESLSQVLWTQSSIRRHFPMFWAFAMLYKANCTQNLGLPHLNMRFVSYRSPFSKWQNINKMLESQREWTPSTLYSFPEIEFITFVTGIPFWVTQITAYHIRLLRNILTAPLKMQTQI